MGAFEDIKLVWAGKQYSIPARKALQAIAMIEECITFQELLRYSQAGQVPFAKVSKAYAIVLRYAGADFSDEEIYEGMFSEEHALANAMAAMQGLMEMMIPPSVKKRMLAGAGAPAPVLAPGEKEAPQGNLTAPTKGASKPISSSASRRAGAVQRNSGTSSH